MAYLEVQLPRSRNPSTSHVFCRRRSVVAHDAKEDFLAHSGYCAVYKGLLLAMRIFCAQRPLLPVQTTSQPYKDCAVFWYVDCK